MAARWPEMGMDFAMATNVPYMYGLPATTTTTTEPALRIDDILDFSDHNTSNTNINNAEPANIVAPQLENSTPSPIADMPRYFADNLYDIPCEEAAELEWLSQFVEDSFSNNPYPLSTVGQPPAPAVTAGSGQRQADTTAAPRGVRSKRSRVSAAHLNQNQLLNAWSGPPPPAAAAEHSTSSSATTSSSSSSDFSSSKPKGGGHRRRGGEDGGVRRCTHCASDKTPQWRTGPLGPKTLCNACGVRFKSGRLVPEYRPAASPTFVLAHHSNSHRKVMELRRQKELVLLRHDGGGHHHPSAAEEMLFNDYEVC